MFYLTLMFNSAYCEYVDDTVFEYIGDTVHESSENCSASARAVRCWLITLSVDVLVITFISITKVGHV